ncbi:MAG: hypothetical protein CMM58_02210 [Rhodospirillaceae bacterium]|nr:hypothetical protein [Rhodospirillaceae bacterium]|tara:strand:- start:1058 stop:1504 length:447 start_codon:yes stop_codon:yes gene_type:complete
MIRALLLISGLLTVAFASAADPAIDKLSVFTREGNTHTFDVEIANTNNKRAKGLMFRKSLGEEQGMLFLYEEEKPILMWMKNTLIPLDMLFINEEGLITHIVEQTVPLSLDIISSNGDVLAVLELLGGTSARLDIRVGDSVKHAAFIE